MISINHVNLVGYLTKDPVLHRHPDKKRILYLSVATTDEWKDKSSGVWKDKIEYHTVRVTNDKIIDVIEHTYKQGDMVNAQGELRHRNYTDSLGKEYSVTEIEVAAFRGHIKSFRDESVEFDDDH